MEPTITHVVKRDGSREPLDISKIQKQTSAATQGLKNVSQSELELDAKLNFIDGITSEQIQQILIKTAVDKIDLDKPDWTFVAARLFLFDLTHKVRQAYKQYGYNEITLEAYLAVGKKENRLLSNLGYGYDLTKLQSAIDTQRDYLFNYLGIKTLYDRYLVKDFDKNPIETPQLMFMGIAMFLAQNESSETKTDWAIKFYNTLSTFKFMLATPTLTNARTLKHQLSSCFVGSAPDNIEGIFDSYKEISLLSKFGGGIGWDFAKIRATGSQIRGYKSASGGLIPFLKILNDEMVAVDQVGTRRGSASVYLEPWHLDVKDFLDLKKNSGEERRRTHELFPALWINGLFMDRVAEDKDWTLFDPYEVPHFTELYGDEFNIAYEAAEQDPKLRKQTIRAKDLWKHILTSYYESGSPFLTFKDRANITNPNKHTGVIHSTNLCFTGDTLVAVADGRNAVTIKQLAEESKGLNKFPVYCANSRKYKSFKEKAGKKNGGYTYVSLWGDTVKNAVAFKTGTKKVIKVTLETGDTFKCTPDHQIALLEGGYVEAKDSLGKVIQPFYTYTNVGPGNKYRHINSLVGDKQADYIWKFHNGEIPDKYSLDHIDSNAFNDRIENLQILTKEEHLEKTTRDRLGERNPIHRKSTEEDEAIKSYNCMVQTTGLRNLNASPLSNAEFVSLLKVLNKTLPGKFNQPKYEYIRDQFNLHQILPLTLSDYRFGGKFANLRPYVEGDQEYNGEFDGPELSYKPRIDFNRDRKDFILKHYVKYFKENEDDKFYSMRRTGVAVINIEYLDEEEDVYDLTVEDTHNFYIITSHDENYGNCNGILVHNCTEIFQSTKENQYKVRIYLDPNSFENKRELLYNETDQIKVNDTEAIEGYSYKLAKHITSLDTIIIRSVLSTTEAEYKVYAVENVLSKQGKTAVCNLGSLNLSKVNKTEDIKQIIPIAVRMLDNVIDLNFYSVKKTKDTNLETRAIGLGVMGEAEYLAQQNIVFGSPNHYKEIDRLMSDVSYYTIEASSDLAKERKPYQDFKGSLWDQGIFPLDFTNSLTKALAEPHQQDWDALKAKVKAQGLRNGYLMAIAPTSSISILVGTTQAIEPVYKRKWYEDNLSGMIPVVVPNLTLDNWHCYVPAYELDQIKLIEAAAVRQKYIDQGQSLNIFIDPKKAKASYLSSIYQTAYKLNLKSTYYLRSESPDEKKFDAVDRSIECQGCQ